MKKYKYLQDLYSISQGRLIKKGEVIEIDDPQLIETFDRFAEKSKGFYEVVKEDKPKKTRSKKVESLVKEEGD